MSPDETVGGLLRREPDEESTLEYTPKQLDIIRGAIGNPNDSPVQLVERMKSDQTMKNVSVAYVRNVLTRISPDEISDEVIESITGDTGEPISEQDVQQAISEDNEQMVSLVEGDADHPPAENAITLQAQIPATVQVVVDRRELEKLANVSLSLKPKEDDTED